MTDTTAPKLLGLTFPSVIDLSNSTTEFSFTVQAEDDVAVRLVSVYFSPALYYPLTELGKTIGVDV